LLGVDDFVCMCYQFAFIDINLAVQAPYEPAAACIEQVTHDLPSRMCAVICIHYITSANFTASGKAALDIVGRFIISCISI